MMKAWVDLEVRKPLRPRSVNRNRLTSLNRPTSPPPPLFSTDLLWGRGREGWVQSHRNKPPEGSTFEFFGFFWVFFHYMCNIYTYVQLFFYVQISSRCWPVGGSAEQPLQGPDGRAPNQPKPHPSSRIVWRCYVISSDRLIKFAPRRLPTGRP